MAAVVASVSGGAKYSRLFMLPEIPHMEKTRFHCLTLRIDPQLDEILTETCWDHRTTKASWTRAALRQSLGIQNPMPQRLRKDTIR